MACTIFPRCNFSTRSYSDPSAYPHFEGKPEHNFNYVQFYDNVVLEELDRLTKKAGRFRGVVYGEFLQRVLVRRHFDPNLPIIFNRVIHLFFPSSQHLEWFLNHLASQVRRIQLVPMASSEAEGFSDYSLNKGPNELFKVKVGVGHPTVSLDIDYLVWNGQEFESLDSDCSVDRLLEKFQQKKAVILDQAVDRYRETDICQRIRDLSSERWWLTFPDGISCDQDVPESIDRYKKRRLATANRRIPDSH